MAAQGGNIVVQPGPDPKLEADINEALRLMQQYKQELAAYAADPQNTPKPKKPNVPFFVGGVNHKNVVDALGDAQEKITLGETGDSARAKHHPKDKTKHKYKSYEQDYPKKQKVSENTKSYPRLNTGFVDGQYKETIEKTIGTGAIYSLPKTSKDDKERVESGIAAKQLVSNEFNSFEAHHCVVVSLTESDQYFGTIDVRFQPDAQRPDKIDIKVPFLKGVTVFAPMLPPPSDKRYRDYLDDIRRFGIGTENSAFQQALGQSNQRFILTLYQAAISQCFFVHDTYYNLEKSRTLVQKPRIVMFYKKFIETDNAWSRTIPGGNELYESTGMCPSKDNVEQLMKTYLSNPTFGERIHDINEEYALRDDVIRAFKNLQLSEEAYAMIRHTMASTYVNLVTSIAETYILSKAWEFNSPIGTLTGFPPGLIMPQHIAILASNTLDNTFNGLNLSRGAELLPMYRAHTTLKYALSAAQEQEDIKSRRLYLDGEEWLNTCSPNFSRLVYPKLSEVNAQNGITAKQLKESDEAVTDTILNTFWNLNTFPFDLTSKPHSSFPVQGVIGSDPTAIAKTINKNLAILNAIKPQLDNSLDPNDAMIFQTWDVNTAKNIVRPRSTPITVVGISKNPKDFRRAVNHYSSKRQRNDTYYVSSGSGPRSIGRKMQQYMFKNPNP
jgi:hypothetical protein